MDRTGGFAADKKFFLSLSLFTYLFSRRLVMGDCGGVDFYNFNFLSFLLWTLRRINVKNTMY